jgi:DNA-binding NarL/FixJ family response regulator
VTVRVLLVDDQQLVRIGFTAIIESADDLEVVGQAGDGADALELAATCDPHVVLMDIRMPGMDGLTATREIMTRHPGVRVLVLTTFRRDEYVFAALRAGASGFLLKDCEPGDLVAAIRTIAAGEAMLAPTVTRQLIDAFAAGAVAPSPSPAADGRLSSLTRREVDVLREVARGLSNTEVAAVLGIGTATAKTHLNAVFTKLGFRDRVQATIFAYDVGLVRPGSG